MLGVNVAGRLLNEDNKTYDIEVKTANISGSGTDAKISISLFGTEDELLNIPLLTSLNNKDPFETNALDVFSFENRNIGKLTKINVGHDDSGLSSAWNLDYVKVIINKVETYNFNANRWLDKDNGDKKIRVDLFPADKPAEKPADKPAFNPLASVQNISNTVNEAVSKYDPQTIDRIKRKFNLISKGESTISSRDGILLVRAIGENPSKKEYSTVLEELKLTNKEKLDLKDAMLILEKMWKNEPKTELEKSLQMAFKRFDKNNDGFIDMKDFEEKMTKSGEKLSADEFQDLISTVDIDHNGRISYAEFVKLFTQ